MDFDFPLKILYYDAEERSAEEVVALYQLLAEKYNGNVIALPKNYDLLCNASMEQLKGIKEVVEEAIKYRKQLEKRIEE